MEYVPIDDNIRTNSKVFAVANEAKMDPDEVAKCLIWLFIEAKKSFPDGIVTALDGDEIRLAAIFGFRKRAQLGQALRLWEALKTVRIERDGVRKSPIITSENGKLYIHDWMEDGCGSFLAEREDRRRVARDKKRLQRMRQDGDKAGGSNGDVPTPVPVDVQGDKEGDVPGTVPATSPTQLESELESLNTNPPTPRGGTGTASPLPERAANAKNKNDEPPSRDPTAKEVVADDLKAMIAAKEGGTYKPRYGDDVKARVLCGIYKAGVGKSDGRPSALKHIPKRLRGMRVPGDAEKYAPVTFTDLHGWMLHFLADFDVRASRDGPEAARAYTPHLNTLFGQAYKITEWCDGPKEDPEKAREETARRRGARIGKVIMDIHGQAISKIGGDKALATNATWFRETFSLDDEIAGLCARFGWTRYLGDGYRGEGAFRADLWEFLKQQNGGMR